MTLRTWELGCFRRRRSGVGHPTRVLLPPHEGAVCLTEGAGNLTFHQLPRNSGPMLSSDELLRACHSAGRSGSFSIREQAHARAWAQGHSPADVRHALAEATSCELADDRWTVRGPSLDGTELTLSVVLAGRTLSVV
jgi:hypothetical protein